MFDGILASFKSSKWHNRSTSANKENVSINTERINSLIHRVFHPTKYTAVKQQDEELSPNGVYLPPRALYSRNDINNYVPTYLPPREKYLDEMDNVLDKFVHIIQLYDNGDHKLNETNKRNDREEIRRRLAMDAEDDYFNKVVSDKPGRKPSLQSRLQSGMNLQICFMNETASDNESPSSDSESCPKLSKGVPHNRSTLYTTSASLRNGANNTSNPYTSKPLSSRVERTFDARPKSLAFAPQTIRISDEIQSDFFTKQAKLQIEARMALAQAKDMAHMQMEIDRQKLKESPITTMIRNALQKAGVKFPKEKRRVSRQLLTDMNVAQLQIIVNEMHTQIERLNEQLVQFLMERDELHMGQDSMLVDIEDLTRYLTAKEANEDVNDDNVPFKNPNRNIIGSTTTVNNRIESVKSQKQIAGNQTMQTQSSSQNKLLRIASLVKK